MFSARQTKKISDFWEPSIFKMRVGELPWEAKPKLHVWRGKKCRYIKCKGCGISECPFILGIDKYGKDDFVSRRWLNHGDVILRDFGEHSFEVSIVEFKDFHGNDIEFHLVEENFLGDDDDEDAMSFEEVLEIKEHLHEYVNDYMLNRAYHIIGRGFESASIVTFLSSPEELARSEKKRTWIKRTREEIVKPLLKRMLPALPRDVREMIANRVFNE